MNSSSSVELGRADANLADLLRQAQVTDLNSYIVQAGKRRMAFPLSDPLCLPARRFLDTSALERRLNSTRSGPFVLMCSVIGYERQRAIEAARDVNGAFCLGLLIIRLNDWVAQVRVAARYVLEQRLETCEHSLLLGCTTLVYSSAHWGRIREADREWLKACFDQRIGSGALAAELIARRDGSAAKLARWLLRTPDLDRHLPEIAAQARHPSVRLAASKAIIAGAVDWRDGQRRMRPLTAPVDRHQTITMALVDRSPAVRQAAISAFATLPGSDLDRLPILQRMLLDRSVRVAEICAFWLKRAGLEPAEVVRAHIRSGTPMAPATLLLLGSIGTKDDHQILLKLARISSGRNRWAALTGAARLEPTVVIPILEATILGDDADEARRAVRAMMALGRRMDWQDLDGLADTPAELVGRNLLQMVNRLAPWHACSVLLKLAVRRDNQDETGATIRMRLAPGVG